MAGGRRIAGAGEVGGESDACGVLAGSAPRRIIGGVAPGLSDPVLSRGAEPPRVEVGGVPPDVGMAGGQLVHAQRPSVAEADRRVVVQSDLCSTTVLAQGRSAVTCSPSHAGPLRWCITRCPLSSGCSSSACTAMCE